MPAPEKTSLAAAMMGGEAPVNAPEAPPESNEEIAVEEVMEAFKSGNKSELRDALSAFVDSRLAAKERKPKAAAAEDLGEEY